MPKVIPGYKEEVKRRIIKAAFETAYEKGFSDVKMGDVSKRLGISRSTLYIYFKSRDEILREILSCIRNHMINKVIEALEEKSLEEAFSNIFYGFIFDDKHFGGGIIFEIIAQTEHDENLKAVVSEHYLALGRAISEVLTAQQKCGNIPCDVDVETAAKTIQALTLGIKASSLLGLEKDIAAVIWKDSIKKALSI